MNDRPIVSRRTGELVGYLHKTGGAPIPARELAAPEAPSRHDLPILAEQYRTAVNPERLGRFAERMGLGVASLLRLRVGWSGSAWAFPMTDARGTVIGVRLRSDDGRKYAVRGSRNGLFVPVDLPAEGPLLVCEGPTSCAALLDLGFAAVGRPSCSGGGWLVRDLLRRGARRDVVLFGDHDEAKPRPDGSVFYPGQEGADRLAADLLPAARSLKVVVPPFAKDARDWKRDGATRDVVNAVIRAANYVRAS
jgi:hypothetical protein